MSSVSEGIAEQQVATQPKLRVQCFIDGYNLYHGIDEAGDPTGHWVDLKKLCKRYLPSTAEIIDVFWFSAQPSHLSKSINDNYTSYSKALSMSGVSLVSGRFKRKPAKCEGASGCGMNFFKHEEKESDVNLAISLVANACNDKFDIGVVITADSDLCPPIRFVRDNFPEKELWLFAPPGRIKRANDLCVISTKSLEINAKALRACLMRDDFYEQGQLVASRPQAWRIVPNRGRRGGSR